ncbi:MAG: heat-inducible transcriptional repressor HrcA [Coprobacillus sp.]|nr:heat-inducible transcriptional repressor HrcA [Coprobacillus sp.]
MLSRKDQILKYIVEYFIKNAEPVGSKTLIEVYNLPYSSATIRNEMMALEKDGYIEKTHQSSGRVPSSKGYRYYCDHLRNDEVDKDLKNALQTILSNKRKSIEETLEKSCEILSHMTSLVSIVLGPEEGEEKLASIQLIPINDNTVTSVFVTDRGYVENKTFIVQEGIKADDLVSCVKIINDRLVGTPVNELVDKMESIKPLISEYIVNHDMIYQALLETFVQFASDRMSLYGREELFNNPEFKEDADKLTRMLKLLDNSSALKEVKDDKDEVNVHIGDIEGNPDVSMISAKVKIGEGENTIALIGPTRMDYDKALSALEYIASQLNDYFEEGGNNDGNT